MAGVSLRHGRLTLPDVLLQQKWCNYYITIQGYIKDKIARDFGNYVPNFWEEIGAFCWGALLCTEGKNQGGPPEGGPPVMH